MSDGNKFDAITYTQQRQQNQFPLEEMGNVLLDAMQGTLMCLDHHHIIIDVSRSIKRYFGFEQADILGLSILLLVEDSERDFFAKFLSSTSQLFDICSVRMMMAIINEYRPVKVHRKRKFNQETADVHSTTTRSVGTILVLTLDDSSYIDISLFDVHKQEFYTKMNLIGEITFEDHRGALITGYLPHEIISQSIFSLVYHEDRLVKLHALWKCATTGGSKLQWRLTARDGSLVFLQTEYKLIANHQNQDTIVARNEVLNPVQRAQFEELQTAWRHQCAADIRGNSSSFKRMTSVDTDPSSLSSGECCICVPSLNMCFSTNKLHSLNIIGNIFDVTKPARPLTIQDYVSILIDHDKHLDSELIHIINSLSSLSSRYRQFSQQSTNETDSLDITMNEKPHSDSSEFNARKKSESDSIVRGILNISVKYNHEKPTGDSSTLTRLLNGNSGQNDLPIPQQQQSQLKTGAAPLNPEAINQQHIDFIKKYRSAKAKLEAQLEATRSQELANGLPTSDIIKRNTILNKLSQLETIKNKHLARTYELKRQTQQATASPPMNSLESNHFSPSLSSPKSVGLISTDSNSPMALQSPFYQHQRNSPPVYRPFESNQSQPSYHDPYTRVKTPVFEEFLTPSPSSSSSSYHPVHNSSLSVHSYMNVSYQDTTTNSSSSSSSFNHHSTTYPY